MNRCDRQLGEAPVPAPAGMIVAPAVVMFDRLKIDDPVRAPSVHLVNGFWGAISVGLFATAAAPGGGDDGLFYGGGLGSLYAQLIGIVAVGVFTMLVSLAAWAVIRQIWGMRVEPEDEMRGLDLSEMRMEAYAGDVKQLNAGLWRLRER